MCMEFTVYVAKHINMHGVLSLTPRAAACDAAMS